MNIEVTGIIKSATERITDVFDVDGQEYSAAYTVQLQLDLDHRSFLRLKRMELLHQSVKLTLEAAQAEFNLDKDGMVLQAALE